MKQSIVVGIVCLVFGVGLTFGFQKIASEKYAGALDFNDVNSFNVSSSTVVIGPNLLVTTNTGRIYAVITNGGTTTLALNLSTIPTSSPKNYSIFVPAGGSYVINNQNLYRGPIYASSTGPAVNNVGIFSR